MWSSRPSLVARVVMVSVNEWVPDAGLSRCSLLPAIEIHGFLSLLFDLILKLIDGSM